MNTRENIIDNLSGLQNFIGNIKPIIDKIHNNQKVSKEELNQIKQFYNETKLVVAIVKGFESLEFKKELSKEIN